MSKSRYRVPASAALLTLALVICLLALKGLRDEGGAEHPGFLAWREAADTDLFGEAGR